ncbi:MAG TPA: hypothetical protein VID27_15550, partial [Blastocatellia bacterium]
LSPVPCNLFPKPTTDRRPLLEEVKNGFIACLILIVLVVGLPAARSQNSQAGPKVSAGFQSEIARLAAEGLRLKEALEASLETGANHLVAVFERASPKAPNETMEFRIIESDSRGSRTIFRRT